MEAHRLAVCFFLFLNAMAIATLNVWVSALHPNAAFTSVRPLAFVAPLMLCPGKYAT
jgi:hypothetical protein